MPLPMFSARQAASIAYDRRPQDDSKMDHEIDPALKEVAELLLSAIEHKSIMGIAEALEHAHHIVDASLHEEGPHSNEE